ncbi:hypothetical protein SETIT_8G086200v2 [Setaria italica]|uniref:Jacalin-type lectin domain-containing protein n=1 Tax=Setaria italica TaxID=4555 RepID=K3ZMH8_SETIT|nr:hypothetical protein SETIT_8G086200v2 [Setaria italica]
MEGLIKIGPCGGSGGDPRDDIVAAGVAPHCLQSIIIRCQGAVDAISFTYAGIYGAPCMAGPWGGSSRSTSHMFVAGEFVKEISGTYGPFGGHTIVRSLMFVTNVHK